MKISSRVPAVNRHHAAATKEAMDVARVASFTVLSVGNTSLPEGTVFTVISNTAATSISETLSNLAAGAILASLGITSGPATTRGDGNDLTLTVVP